ncbi:uncharacterized protein [Littorina saxatilis]|uniref:uncharacterized protein n=1 Tax=Littorina saxatilis TaxID=31220 RepID=UPI0038B6A634
MFIDCQTRDGNIEEFFRHENQACPPALSDGGSLCTGTKSDLLTCLEEVSDAKTETPVKTCFVLDGAAIVQMLKPAASKTSEDNKTELFRFLSAALIEWFDQEDKQLIITDGEAVLSKPLLPDLTSLAPCNHEEADSLMLLHASHAAQHGHHAILIRTIDTDDVVLAVSLYLEEIGVMDKVNSIAGASAGGMFAGLVAVGYNSYEIEDFLSERIDKIFLGKAMHRLTKCFYIASRDLFDLCWLQLYQKYGKKLCIIVTNLNHMTTEYCHPKTTPDMPIRTALRMSMAIPGLFSAMKYKHHGTEDVYVDGGVLCNYPIHCFDGWYLSMKPEDSFMRRLQPLRDIPLIMERNNRFGDYNDNTLGMLLYSDAEEDILRINLERRVGCLNPPKPEKETKLYLQRQKEAKMKQRAEREHARVVQAVDSFLRVLKKHNIDRNDVIDRHELEAAFQDEKEFPRDQAEVLFGKDFTVTQAFEILDRDDNGRIRYDELVRFIEENGVSLQSRFLGYERKEIKNFMTFLGTLQSCLIFNVKRLYVEERDLERTVGINTGHIHTTDFVLEEPDRDFVVQRGYNSMMAFLKYYVAKHPDKVRRKMGDRLTVPDISELPETTTTPTPDGEETPLLVLREAASKTYIANCQQNNGLDVVDSDISTLSRTVEG